MYTVPIYTFGSADPRSYARGKRGIAGSLVFAQFDRHALIEELQAIRRGAAGGATKRGLFASDNDTSNYSNQGIVLPAINAENEVVGVDTWGHRMTSLITSNGGSYINFEELLNQTFHRTSAYYSDQLPAFHVTVAMANEYGQAASMRILYAEILNEGVGMSIDDTVIEQAMTFVARRIVPVRSATSDFRPQYSG